MGTTIFKTLLVDSIPNETPSKSKLRQVVRRHTKDRVYDGQAIYDELVKLNGFKKPGAGDEATLLEPWENAGEIQLQDGTPAGIKVTRAEHKMFVQIFSI